MTSRRSDFLRPENSESLLGYIRRLGRAKAHYFTSDFFVELCNKYGRRLVDDIVAIEQELGVPPGTLERLAPSSPPKDPSRDWQYERLHSDPVCPQCLAEKKPYQALWRHSLVTACHKHRLRLVDVCPNCSERLTPQVARKLKVRRREGT
ncbi:TniQ family protein [uncultured Ruegeria sp.]|uniref:TniQ family protein n=1 Tax=uncultured Ruegeria sp. TaxID=259304 RepID=UPI00344F9C5A